MKKVGAYRPEDASLASAFTVTDLLVAMATLGLLAFLALPAFGNAKVRSRQLSCLENLRQLGIASHMYVVDYQQYTGNYSAVSNVYVWPKRLLGYVGGNRIVFSCPAAIPSARWDTNLNSTLGTSRDPYGVTPNSRFSYGFNDWGLSLNANPQLGLGGDVDGAFYHGPVRDNDVVAPSQMILLADVPALANANLITFGANLDPTDASPNHSQWPSNRHEYLIDIVFTDGHTETPTRPPVIDPANTNSWRSRWNNDNRPHTEYQWAGSSAAAGALDPSY